MPKIKIEHKDLEKLVGKKITLKKLEKISPNIKCEWEGEKEGEIALETTHDRPDLLSTEGIARSIKNYLGLKKGIQEFKFKKSGLKCTIEKSVSGIRPYSRMFIVKNVILTDALIQQLMQLQEKIHLSYTTRRKNASIGVYDLDSFEFPIKYCVKEHINFTPLGEQEPMSAKEILEKTEKGREYADLVTPGKYPLILDKKNLVLSMPPILNSEETKLKPSTKNLFVDVSGEDELLVKKVAVWMATALSERGEVQTVTMDYMGKQIESPEIQENKMQVSTDYVNKMLGTKLTKKEVVELLEKTGFGTSVSEGKITASIPCYRFDIMHPIDLVEEIAMAYGYNYFEPLMPKVSTNGRLHPIEKTSGKARSVMIGAGFQEVLTFILTSKNLVSMKNPDFVELANPVSEEHNIVRNTLIPNLLELISNNKHHPLPQKIFEVGDIVEKKEVPLTQRKLAGVIVDSEATFTEMKSVLEVLSKNLDFKYSLKETNESFFIEGRVGEIKNKNKTIGTIGEIHPQVLNQLEIEHPTVAFELNLEKIG